MLDMEDWHLLQQLDELNGLVAAGKYMILPSTAAAIACYGKYGRWLYKTKCNLGFTADTYP